MALDERIVEDLDTTLEVANHMMESEGMQKLLENAAKLSANYYKELIRQGVPAEHAALIAASYSGQIGKTK